MRTPIIVSPAGDGGFTVWLPGCPSCISAGATVEEAVRNAARAVISQQLQTAQLTELTVPDGAMVMFVSILDAAR